MSAPVTEDTVATTEAVTETPAPAAESVETEKEPVDTTAFEEAVEALLNAPAGTETKDLVLAVRREYHNFDRNGKTVARKMIEDQGISAVMNSQLDAAQTLIRLKDEMIKPLPVSGQPRAPRAPKNSTEDVVAQIASIQLAYSLSMLKANSNSELDADWQSKIADIATAEAQDRAGAYAAWLEAKQEGDEPEASEVEKAAARVSLGRAPKGQGRKPKSVEEAAKMASEAEDQEAEAADATEAAE